MIKIPKPIAAALNPELLPAVFWLPPIGWTLQHPLVGKLSLQSATQVTLANEILSEKRRMLDEARKSDDWHSFVFLHERPYRLNALLSIRDMDSVKPRQWWPLVASVWGDAKGSTWANFDSWCFVWDTPMPGRGLAMEAVERKTLRQLPDELRVWRGISHKDAASGLSWTLERDKAVWFANRNSGPPLLASGMVSKVDVLAYLNARNESEIVAFPNNVRSMKIQRLVRPNVMQRSFGETFSRPPGASRRIIRGLAPPLASSAP